MGQRGSKMHNKEPVHYAGAYSYGNTTSSHHDQYVAEQYRREHKKKEQKRKRSRMNGIVAASVGAA